MINQNHPNIFNGLSNLKEINFSSNKIKDLDKDIFHGLINLSEINFSFNELEAIDPDTFFGLNLELINFSSNKILYLNETLETKKSERN